MARSIAADLLAKQSTNIQPALQAIFTSRDGGTTYNYSFNPTVTTNRWESIVHRESEFDEQAEIILRNDDLVVPDLRGYYVNVGYGANTDSGLLYGVTPRLWVKQQAKLSSSFILGDRAQMKVILALTGVWRMMAEQPVLLGNAPYYQDENELLEGKTVYGILEYLIETSFTAQVGYTFTLSPLGTQDDSIINDYVPEITHDPDNPLINPNGIESYLTLIKRLMAMTKCRLRAKSGLAFEVVYPQSTDAYDETYYSYQAHYFYEHKDIDSVVVPNHVIVYGLNADGTIAVTANWYNPNDYATPPTFSGQYVPTKYLNSLGTTLQWQVDNYAAAQGSVFQAAGSQTRLVIPHDSRVELYDRIKVYDTRNQ